MKINLKILFFFLRKVIIKGDFNYLQQNHAY